MVGTFLGFPLLPCLRLALSTRLLRPLPLLFGFRKLGFFALASSFLHTAQVVNLLIPVTELVGCPAVNLSLGSVFNMPGPVVQTILDAMLSEILVGTSLMSTRVVVTKPATRPHFLEAVDSLAPVLGTELAGPSPQLIAELA